MISSSVPPPQLAHLVLIVRLISSVPEGGRVPKNWDQSPIRVRKSRRNQLRRDELCSVLRQALPPRPRRGIDALSSQRPDAPAGGSKVLPVPEGYCPLSRGW